MNQLTNISIAGFRSIQQADIVLRPLNVFIGANGSGKSNLIAFLQMLNFALSKGLQTYVQRRGGSQDLLHFGPKRTPLLTGRLTFWTDRGRNEYRFSMAHAQGDTLIYTHEETEFHADTHAEPISLPLGNGGHKESGLAEPWSQQDPTAQVIRSLLGKCRVYQFHDTSPESHLRGRAELDDNLYLRADGGNLPAFLLRLKSEAPASFIEIERTLRIVLPWFQAFVLEPQRDGRVEKVLLRWRMPDQPDYEFTPSHLSDGSLRIMALVTLLLQPSNMRPQLIVLDEPELGLHPAAERVVAGLIQTVTQTSQVLVATQSATFVDHFQPEDVVVVENEAGCSTFARQSSEHLKAWMDRYTLGQIWQKDIIGGRP